MRQRTLKVGLVALVATAVLGGSAGAGEYHVYSCRMPDGQVAPVDGWVGSVAAGGAWDDYATNTCDSGGALTAALGDQTTHLAYVDRATWEFDVPGFDRLTAAGLFRAAYVHGVSGEEVSYETWIAGPLAKNVIEECVFSEGCQRRGVTSIQGQAGNELAVPSKNLGSHIYVNAGCGAGGEKSQCSGAFTDPSNYAAVIYLYAADLTLEQTAGPSTSGTGGELATAPTIAGTSDVTFNATDPGAGVYEAIFSVDGKVVQSTVINEAGGRCRNVGQTTDGLPAFLYLQPCPASVSADVGFDTTRVANGVHHMVVSVIDAAGNSAPVLDRNVNVQNPGAPGPPNGVGASTQASLAARWGSTARSTLRTAFGRREAIRGRLTDAGGKPISGAMIDASATPTFTGGKTISMKAVHTAPDGRFVLQVPSGVSSRTILLAYRAHLGDPRPVASKTLRLSVRASLSLRITPRTASAGSTIRFNGRLLGGPIPHGGKSLVLEARSGGAWIEFDVIRSDRHGRYHAGYTFKFPGPAHYQFRVLCEAEADYPFASGSSPVVGVTEH
jgi:hypothetical protein